MTIFYLKKRNLWHSLDDGSKLKLIELVLRYVDKFLNNYYAAIGHI